MITLNEDGVLKQYFFDLDKIAEFVSQDKASGAETELTEVYRKNAKSDALEPVEKTIRDIKPGNNVAGNNINYDLVKLLMGVLLTTSLNPMTTFTTDEEEDDKDAVDISEGVPVSLFGLSLAFNTMKQKEFLVEIESNDEDEENDELE